MKTIEYRTIDKSKWPLRGEWDNEPDKVQWQDEATGLPCLIVRTPHSGHLCGYVGVAEGHPMYGKGYDDVTQANGEYIDVHGGLTFANKCQPSETESRGICHLPEPGEPDHVWWFGFDCAHAWDLSPVRYDPKWICGDEHYRDIAYVRSEVAKLAAQLKAAS
jgi:hypothetical protein